MSKDISWFAEIIEAIDKESATLENIVVRAETLRDGISALVAERDDLAAKLEAAQAELHDLRIRAGVKA
jgi:hypothetical protein